MALLKRFSPTNRRRVARVVIVGTVVLAFAAPALAEHFDWGAFADGSGTEELNAEAVHVVCPEPGEGEDSQQTCDGVVTEAAQELVDSDHPDNHGRYVSFIAHCLKGMERRGEKTRVVAQADEETQAEVAVQVCGQFRIDEISELGVEDEAASEESENHEAKLEKSDGHRKGNSQGSGRGPAS